MTSRRVAALAAAMVWCAGALSPAASSAQAWSQAGTSASATPTLTQTLTTQTPSARTLKGARQADRISVRVLPQIAQPGRRTARAARAKSPLLVGVKPSRVTVVTLQAKAGKKWRTVRSATTDRRGRHVFHVAAKRGGKAAKYRVAVGAKRSKAVSTQRWLSPKFTDNFTGAKLSPRWEHRKQYRDPHSNRSCSRGARNAVKVTGGALRLSVLKDRTARRKKCLAVADGQRRKFSYRLNGHVSTESSMSFRYGFAAARIKFPRAQGQHGAFWLQPVAPDYRTSNPRRTGAEIDVIESFGANAGPQDSMGLSSFTYHWVGKKRQPDGRYRAVKTGGYLRNVPGLLGRNNNVFDRYHVFSVEWTPKAYVFRIDGKETWRSTKGVSGTEQYAILSLLSSDWELGRARSEKRINEHMHVDWLRVWETGAR